MNKEETKIVEKVETVVCEMFGVSTKDVLNKGHKSEQSIARAFVFYILHEDYNISGNRLAKIYYRNIRGIWAQIAKIKASITKIRMYRDYASSIRNKLKQ